MTIIDVTVLLGTTNLGNRDQGRTVRAVLEEAVHAQTPLTLDCSQVDCLTSMFADECFGKLWDQHAHQDIITLLHITGLSRNDRAIFRWTLAHR